MIYNNNTIIIRGYSLFMYIYRQLIELRKGNVSVVSVCHSVPTGGPHVTITHDALDLTVFPLPPPDLGPSQSQSQPDPASDIWWPSLKICSNLFT